ncbi:MAG: hypothetical protein ACNS61_03385, partial [Candidatus Wenzhouxiangella sp. M2_3B_020]
MRRALLPLLLLCWLLLMAAPVSSAEAGFMPVHPVAVAGGDSHSGTGHSSECHPFLHAPETVSMAVESQAERDPAELSPAIAEWGWGALPAPYLAAVTSA